MTHTLADDLLSRLSDAVAAHLALHFPHSRWHDLERKIRAVAKETGAPDLETFIQGLLATPWTSEQTALLAAHLTISESFFWREPHALAALTTQILPALIQAREADGTRRLRLWSAGCSTGEEPYSLAIALHRMLPRLKDWQITLLATDINPRVLHKASAGVYTEWSFRNAPSWLLKNYFHLHADGKREILPEIRRMVTFAYVNLVEDVYPSTLNNTNAMDIIFCRNVLMYFTPEHAQAVARRLSACLRDDGWLVVSASELSRQCFSQFTAVTFPDAIVYRKDAERLKTAPSHPKTSPVVSTPALSSPVARTARKTLRAPVASALRSGSLPPRNADTRHEAVDADAAREMNRTVRKLADEGRLAEALACCDDALAMSKLSVDLHYLRAMILQELYRDEEAKSSLKHALYLEPNYLLAHFALGNLMRRQGDARTARRCFLNVLSLLTDCHEEEVLSESDGMTAGRFREIIHATLAMGAEA